LRGAINPRVGLFEEAAREIKDILQQEGVADMPLGIDVVEPPFLFALQKLGIEVRDGQQVMLEAREIKSHDEITLLNMAAAMGDGVYQDIYEALKPGVRESEIVAMATKRLYEMGSDCVEAINAIAGERCSPHPHNFTDRLIRPRRPGLFRHHPVVHGLSHVLLPHVHGRIGDPAADRRLQESATVDGRRDRDAEARRHDRQSGAHVSQVHRDRVRDRDVGVRAQFLPRPGLGLHERPLISRLNSLKDPYELKAGMVFAVETFCPATDGVSAARIEEEVVLTPGGAKIITLFPAQELPIANRY
jgi:Xaa-Pro dipeptidase